MTLTVTPKQLALTVAGSVATPFVFAVLTDWATEGTVLRLCLLVATLVTGVLPLATIPLWAAAIAEGDIRISSKRKDDQ